MKAIRSLFVAVYMFINMYVCVSNSFKRALSNWFKEK